MRRPRRTTTVSASSSENTPARQAAVYSPMLCPISAVGSMPQLIQRRAMASSMVKIAGWVTAVRVSSWLAHSSFAASGKRTVRRSRPINGSRIAAHSSTQARKAGSCS